MNQAQPLNLECEGTTGKSTEDTASSAGWRSRKIFRTIAMYLTMVCVSTVAIYLLEHASLLNAFRTALVAAIGKTLAANWVSGVFDCA